MAHSRVVLQGLKSYERALAIALCMIFHENLEGFVTSIFGHQPARTLRYEPDEGQLKEGR